MRTVDLTLTNFSYYAFHPRSKELSTRDKNIALIATVSLAFTAGIGHLISGITYLINRKNINSARAKALAADRVNDSVQSSKLNKSPKPNNVDATKPVNANPIEGAIKKLEGKIEQSISMLFENMYETHVVLMKISVGEETFLHKAHFKDLNCKSAIKLNVETAINDFKTRIGNSQEANYQLHFTLVSATYMPKDVNGNTIDIKKYQAIDSSITQKNGLNIVQGPGQLTFNDGHFNDKSRNLSNIFGVHLNHDLSELDNILPASEVIFF